MSRMAAPAPPPAEELSWDSDGLIPGVVQDARTGRVLMVAYLNRESYRLTIDTGQVHFWSRSRRELWLKGATSGSLLEVEAIASDCDADTLLITVRPSGPACHRQTVTCFDERPGDQGFQWLEELWEVIASRASERPSASYTTKLLEGGVDTIGRKLVEEATEVLLAAKNHQISRESDRRVAEEMADLVYHLLVLAAERELGPFEIISVLEERFSS